MASRITQETKVVVTDTGGTNGGTARVTQVVKVVIATIQMAGGGWRLKGMGS